MTKNQLEAYLAMYRALSAALAEVRDPGVIAQIEMARKQARRVAPVEI
jgi:hypothetical protein